MLCFNKLTGEHNTKKYIILKIFVLYIFKYIFKQIKEMVLKRFHPVETKGM